MPSTAHSASFDGTTIEDQTVEVNTRQRRLARRSVSIFSRKGSGNHQEPRPAFIPQAVMQNPRDRSERQKRWLRTMSLPVQSSSPSKSRGTLLNAVPKTIPMTPLDEEMARSPNIEVVSPIASPPRFKFAPASPSTPQPDTSWAKRNDPQRRQTQHSKNNTTDTRIGLWMSGVTQWDNSTLLERSIGSDEPSSSRTGFSPTQSVLAEELDVRRNSRPQLSVVIPSSELSINDTKFCTTMLNSGKKARSTAFVAPASIVSRFNSASDIPLTESHIVSPVEAAGVLTAPQLVVDSKDDSKRHVSRQSQSSSSEHSLVEHDDASSYSRRSSATSVEVEGHHEHGLKSAGHARTDSDLYSILSPTAAGVFAEPTKKDVDVNKPLPPRPDSNGALEAIAGEVRRLRNVNSTKSESACRPKGRRERSWRTIKLEQIDCEPCRNFPYLFSASAPGSPTLSQAEEELEVKLSQIAQIEETAEPLMQHGCLGRRDSVRNVMQPPERAPTVPRRSRRREWRGSRNVEDPVVKPAKPKDPRRRMSEADLTRPFESVGGDNAAQPSSCRRFRSLDLHRRPAPAGIPHQPALELSSLPQVAYEDGLIVVEGPVTQQRTMDDAALTTACAEEVLLHVLEALPSTRDLFNTAMINKGMYRVYKDNEMPLIRFAMRNQSLPAWEFLEWRFPEPHNTMSWSPALSQLEHSPLSYMRSYRRNLTVIEGLKMLIIERCQTFIRRETADALLRSTHPDAWRFNDALWRIWCFCNVFGSRKGREEDVTGQLDWLKGGLFANNADLSATTNINLEFEMSSVLLNPPEHFAKGNEGGLTAQQLYDMIEIWGCLTSLMQPYHSQTREALKNGVYDSCELFDGDEDRADYLLEEWTAHLLTLGPATILAMASLAHTSTAAGFALAHTNCWTNWTPPQYSGSRTTFLKEPVSRLYEERIATASRALQHPAERERKEQGRKRVATLAAEIRLARQSSAYKRLPLIDQSAERAMSVFSRRDSNASTFSYRGVISPCPSSSTSRSSQQPHTATPNFSSPRPLEPRSLVHAQHQRRISPIIEDKVETFDRSAGTAPEEAVRRITEMGFTQGEATKALRETDAGEGFRVERAVEILLMTGG